MNPGALSRDVKLTTGLHYKSGWTHLDFEKYQRQKKKHAGQPTRERATPLHIHVLPMLKGRGWKQLLFKKRVYMQDSLCNLTERKVLILWSWQRRIYVCMYVCMCVCIYIYIYTHTHNRALYPYITESTYMHPQWKPCSWFIYWPVYRTDKWFR
jgi:hypothetical protein